MSAIHRGLKLLGVTSVLKLVATLLAGALLLGSPPLVTEANAQSAEDFIDAGNSRYNDKKYQDAIGNYVKAVQTDPKNALKGYLNMARAYLQLDKYDEAEQYYNWYLELVEGNEEVSSSQVRKVKGELKKASRRSKGESRVVTEAQTAALKRLQEAMKTGPFLTEDGGGAIALYDVLLRTNYATPQLVPIQKALATGLINEAIELTVPPPGQPTAQLDRDGWKQVRKRLDRAQNFPAVEVDADAIAILYSLSLGWDEYFKGNYSEAIGYFDETIKRASANIPAHWGKVLALLFVDQGDMSRTFTAIDQLEAAWGTIGRSPWPWVPTVRAAALQSAGETQEAAAILRGL